MLTPILNHIAPVAGQTALTDDTWIQIAPLGEFAHRGLGLTQVIDGQAVTAMVNRFGAAAASPSFPGIPVDYDHGIFSTSPAATGAAAGWIRKVDARPDGLWAQVQWTTEGRAKVQDGSYKFISPVWYEQESAPAGPKRLRPQRLVAAGLTNNPNLTGLAPITNTRPADAVEPAPQAMPRILTLLGLAAEASEDAACERITVLLNSERAATAAATRITALETENTRLREAEADAIIARYGPRIPEPKRAEVRTAILNHREHAMTLLELLPSPGQDPGLTPLHNRATAGVPSTLPGGQPDPAADAARAEQRKHKALQIQSERHCTWDEAWSAAS